MRDLEDEITKEDLYRGINRLQKVSYLASVASAGFGGIEILSSETNWGSVAAYAGLTGCFLGAARVASYLKNILR